jgi:hypothetical protein
VGVRGRVAPIGYASWMLPTHHPDTLAAVATDAARAAGVLPPRLRLGRTTLPQGSRGNSTSRGSRGKSTSRGSRGNQGSQGSRGNQGSRGKTEAREEGRARGGN